MAAEELIPWINSAGEGGVRNSMIEQPGAGTNGPFEFNFAGGYIDQSHVKAYRYDPVSALTYTQTLTFVGPNQVTTSDVIPVGQFVIIYRDTPKDKPLVDYTEGAVMDEANLDKSNDQNVFIAAEMADRFDSINATSSDAINRSVLALSTANTALDNSQSALSASDSAVQTANAAAALVDQANTKSDQAVATANGIDGKAQQALDNSTAAVSTANAASATANGIDAKATTALSNSASAQAAAESAQAAAESAADSASNAMQRYLTVPTSDLGLIEVSGIGPMEWNTAASVYLPVIRFAECRLDGGSVANSIKLSRAGGSRLTVGSVNLTIPDAGIQVVLTGLALSTVYNVFGYNNAGTLAIEYGTGAAWGHAADPQTGLHVKYNSNTNTYDRSRTYLGMFFCNGSGQVLDNQSQRGVASFYNRVQKFAFASNPAMATGSTTFLQGTGVGCLVWASGSIATSLFGTAYSNANFGMNRACLGINNSPIVPITADAQSTVPNHYVQLAQSWIGLATVDQFMVLQYLLCSGSAGAITTHSGSVNIGAWI